MPSAVQTLSVSLNTAEHREQTLACSGEKNLKWDLQPFREEGRWGLEGRAKTEEMRLRKQTAATKSGRFSPLFLTFHKLQFPKMLWL